MPPNPMIDLTSLHGQRAVENAAILAHEANRGYCEALGDTSQVRWDRAPLWQQDSAKNGVRQIVNDPTTTPEQSHAGWCKEKVADGWTYAAIKDPEKKTHHCLVPYAELPDAQRHKDAIFGAVVREALSCYSVRIMTNESVVHSKFTTPFSCPDKFKNTGLVVALGRATRIASDGVLAHLRATGYPAPAPDEATMMQFHNRVILCVMAIDVDHAYDCWRSGEWPRIHPELASTDELTRIQWHVGYRIAQAVRELEGVRFELKHKISTSVWSYTRPMDFALAVEEGIQALSSQDNCKDE